MEGGRRKSGLIDLCTWVIVGRLEGFLLRHYLLRARERILALPPSSSLITYVGTTTPEICGLKQRGGLLARWVSQINFSIKRGGGGFKRPLKIECAKERREGV